MKNIIVSACFVAAALSANADEKDIGIKQYVPASHTPALKVKLNESGDSYAQFNLWSQFWMRSGEVNPGTLVANEAADQYFDAGIRRMRLSGLFQLNPAYRVYVQVGVNNQSYLVGGGSGTGGNGYGKKPSLFFHDIYNEFTITQRKAWSLNVGGGLHGWSGISRLSNGSSSRILGADFPLVQFPHLERGDQFGRQLGVFAHGHVNKINYRFTLNKPFRTDMQPTVAHVAVDHNHRKSLAHGGYAYYQFFDTEKPVNPYLSGSYLGEKKIFNIGAGYNTTSKSTMSIDGMGNQKFHNNTILGLDAFAELPFRMGKYVSSISAYSVFYNYNMGPNYLRTNGVMNPGTANPAFNGMRALEGVGNSTALLGTGKVWFTQVGWLLPSFANKLALQPFSGVTYKDFKAIPNSFVQYNVGTNLLIDKHHAKLSLQYSNQPIHNATNRMKMKNVGEVLVQAQIML